MKKIFWVIVIFLTACQTEEEDVNNGDDVYSDYYDDYGDTGAVDALSYQTFYDGLSPYGSWINYPSYGYVWSPSQYSGFVPYCSNGHWVYTAYGWTWVSDFSWGWGPFHYGSWFFDASYGGWLWMPGYNWAPAWVMWGNYGDYYCWAPMGPRQVVTPHYRPQSDHWNIVRHDYITQPNLVSHREDNSKFADINSKVDVIENANNYRDGVFFSGPKKEDVEKFVGQKITSVDIASAKQPQQTEVKDSKLELYRPKISSSSSNTAKPISNNGSQQNVNPPAKNINGSIQPQQNNPVRQNGVQQYKPVQPKQNYNPPVQQQRPIQPQPAQRQPDRGFVPYHPAPAPAPQPMNRSFTPAPARPSAPMQFRPK